MTVLLARGVTVQRGRRTLLTGVDLEVGEGAVAYVTGSNGSGKTSLLRVLCGLAVPSRGSVSWGQGCGYVPEKVTLAASASCGEWLRAMRRLRGLPHLDWDRYVVESGLGSAVLGQQTGVLSKGVLQRLALVEAVHSDRDLLVLDEPFAGLDSDGREWLADQLKKRIREGVSIVVTDHSGAARGMLPVSSTVAIQAGRCVQQADTPQADRPRSVRIYAAHAERGRAEHVVDEDESDELLCTLVSSGWHIERVTSS
jgi:heme exporter protein A